ncbi:hypothetical protein ACFSF3_25945 [Vibrio chagasii]
MCSFSGTSDEEHGTLQVWPSTMRVGHQPGYKSPMVTTPISGAPMWYYASGC